MKLSKSSCQLVLFSTILGWPGFVFLIHGLWTWLEVINIVEHEIWESWLPAGFVPSPAKWPLSAELTRLTVTHPPSSSSMSQPESGVRYRAHFGANKSESYFQLDSRADLKRLQAHSWNFTMFWQNFYTRLHMNSVKDVLLTRWRGHCVEDMCPRTAWCCPCLSEGDFHISLFLNPISHFSIKLKLQCWLF